MWKHVKWHVVKSVRDGRNGGRFSIKEKVVQKVREEKENRWKEENPSFFFNRTPAAERRNCNYVKAHCEGFTVLSVYFWKHTWMPETVDEDCKCLTTLCLNGASVLELSSHKFGYMLITPRAKC